MQNVLVSIESEHPVQILPVWGGLFVKYWLRLFDLIVNLSRFHKTQLQRGQILKPWQYLLGYELVLPLSAVSPGKPAASTMLSPQKDAAAKTGNMSLILMTWELPIVSAFPEIFELGFLT